MQPIILCVVVVVLLTSSISLVTAATSGLQFVTVAAPSATYRGLSFTNHREFIGIRYAQAQNASSRWTAPVPITPTPGKVVNATVLGASCIQPSTERPHTSEDCLFLNVWTTMPNVCSASSLCPVLVHIHGGGWVTGSGSDAMYWGDFFSNSTATVVVTLNYRLGALGFLVVPDTSAPNQLSGNFGFLDQRLALQWVATNIAAFGGDPKRVTLQGQSAGGISVATHLTAPKSFGLFQQVAVLSNPTVIGLRPIYNNTHFSDAFSRHLGCSLTNRTCLTTKSTAEILDAQMAVKPDILPPYPLMNSMISPWMIVVDGVNVIDTPSRLVQQNKIAPQVTSLVWGTTKNETNGWIDAIPYPLTVALYKRLLYGIFGDLSTKVFQQYPANRASEVKPTLSFVMNDYMFTCAVRSTVRSSAKIQPTGTYVWMHHPSTYPRNTGTVSHCTCNGCACHGAELTSIFHTAVFANGSFTPPEATLSNQTLALWHNYAQYGFGAPAGKPTFVKYNTQQDNYLSFDINEPQIPTITGWRSEYCDFWDSLGVYNY